jgi:hypothetical protein
MATLIEWNGKESEIRPKNVAQGFTRGELEKLLEGPVEIMSLDDGRLMVTDAGNYRARGPVNIKATRLRQSGSTVAGLAIVGSVVIGCPGEIL